MIQTKEIRILNQYLKFDNSGYLNHLNCIIQFNVIEALKNKNFESNYIEIKAEKTE